jgi:O-antigen/teichoic acid export membrane protein
VILNLFSPVLKSLGRPIIFTANSVLTLVLLVGACIYGVQWGGEGLATAWLATAVLSVIALAISSARAIGVRIREIIADLLPALIVSSIMFVLVSLAHFYYNIDFGFAQGMEIFAKSADLTISILLGVICYIAVARLLFPRLVYEVVAAWRSRKT